MLKNYIISHKYHIVVANVLFCHQINYIFMINARLLRPDIRTFSANFSVLKTRSPPICSLLECMTLGCKKTKYPTCMRRLWSNCQSIGDRLYNKVFPFADNWLNELRNWSSVRKDKNTWGRVVANTGTRRRLVFWK